MKNDFQFIQLPSWPIQDQLCLEEVLLKKTKDNWCLINFGAPPAFVLGISSKIEENLKLPVPFPIIKRYSGGGTVVIDEKTFFLTLIASEEVLGQPLYPENIFAYIEKTLLPAFPSSFALKDRDFVLGDKKCGGNAQYIGKGRFSHHVSFLYEFERKKLDFLHHPKKEPSYRKRRLHEHFLAPLSPYYSSLEDLAHKIKKSVNLKYHLREREVKEARALLENIQKSSFRTSSIFL